MNSSHSVMVSVVVITYNQQETIGQTIESILAQETAYDFEIVIGEDCSTDGTRAVCETFVARYADKIRLLPAAANKGLLRNFIDCLKASQGRYIAGCAGDDYWFDKQKIQKQVDFLEANPDYVLVHADMIHLHVESQKMEYPAHRTDVPEGAIHEELYKKAIVSAPTACYRSEFVHQIDFDQWLSHQFKFEDVPLWLEASRSGKFHYMPFYAVVYRVSSESASHFVSIEKRLQFIDSVYDCLYYYWDKFHPDFPRAEIDKLYAGEVISLSLGSKNWGAIWRAMRKFGFRVVFAAAWHKIRERI